MVSSNSDRGNFSARLVHVSRLFGAVVVMLGLVVMAGWLLGIPILTRVYSAFIPMKFNTAVLLTLSGAAILLLPLDTPVKRALPWVILIYASVILSQYVTGWNLGIDELFVRDTTTTASPGRMSGIAAINFIFVSRSLLLMAHRPRRSHVNAFIACVVALIVLVGYLYHVPALYQLYQFSAMAVHTATGFLLVSIALLLANTQSPFMQMLVSDSAGAKLIRQVLPITLLLLVVLNIVFILGDTLGLYPTDFVMPLNVASTVIALIIIITSLAGRWHETDLQRLAAEEQLRQSYGHLERLVQERTAELSLYKTAVEASNDLIVVVNRDYRYLIANAKHLRYNQMERDEVIGRHVSEIVGQDWFEKLLKPMYDRCFAGENIDFEASPQYPGLGTRHLLTNYSPLRDAEHQVIAAVVIIRDITERKVAENELRLYQSAVEASTEMITLVDRDYRFLMVNNAYLNYHQRRRNDIVGRPVSDIIGQELTDTKLIPIYERCFAGETVQFENTFNFPALGERHTWATYSPLYGEEGQVIGVVATIRDITERKQMELALRENEHKLQTLFDVLPVGVSVLNADRRIVQANPALEDILDMSLSDLQVGKYESRHYIHPDGSTMLPEKIPSEIAVSEQMAVFDVEIGVIKEDNKTVWTSVNAAPLNIPGLSAVVVTQDITHRKQVERALEASMEYLSMLTHALADGIMTVDIKTRTIQFVNQRFCEIFGYNEDELIGQPTRIFYETDEPHAAFGSKLQQAINTGQLPLITERELRRKNGERIWISTATSTLTLDGKVSEAISIVRDITERKHAEVQAELLAIEQRNVKSLREFITNISHDLKTPITQIITSLYLLKRSLGEDKQQKRIAAMETHTNNLRKIIEAMVLMSELDAKESFEFTSLDVILLIADLMKSFAPLAEQKQQTFTLQCTVDRMMLQGDAEYLQLALRGIIENALVYTPECGAINLRVYQHQAEYVIEIQDTGIGIAPDDMPHIFEHFYRADKARAIGEGHTGMGLAMTNKIIRAHGGRIEVTSVLHEGSTFRVFLPASEN